MYAGRTVGWAICAAIPIMSITRDSVIQRMSNQDPAADKGGVTESTETGFEMPGEKSRVQQKKKLLYVCDVYLHSDARRTHVAEIVHNLSRQHEVVAFVPISPGSGHRVDGLDYLHVGRVPFLSMCLFQCRVLVRALRRHGEKPDLVYARLSGYTVAPLLLARFWRSPYFVEINSQMALDAQLRGHSRFSLAVIRRVEEMNCRRADRIFAVTGRIRDRMIAEYGLEPEKVIVTGNGANTDLFLPRARDDCRRALGIHHTGPIVGFVGNLVYWQGIDQLVAAAPSIVRAVPDILFLIVGDGAEYASLTSRVDAAGIRDHFSFTRSVPYDQVPTYIGACDICTAPFTGKRNVATGLSPLKIYEYLACGRPVVASAIEDIRVVLDRSGGGVTTPIDEPCALATAVIAMLASPERMREMGTSGSEYVRRHHSWQSIAERITREASRGGEVMIRPVGDPE